MKEGTETRLCESGVWIEEGILSAQQCDALLDSLSNSSLKRGRAGARRLMANPAVAELASDARLLALAERELGVPAVPYRATLFEKSGRANWLVAWHQDTALPLEEEFDDPEWGPWSLKAGIAYARAPAWALSHIVALRVHLDPARSENGPLRVYPGSHHLGVLSNADVFAYASAHEPQECTVGRGGVLVMRPLVIHASSKTRSGEPRRVLHIEYAKTLDLGAGIRLAIA